MSNAEDTSEQNAPQLEISVKDPKTEEALAKAEGQYKSLQTKHNELLKTIADDDSDTEKQLKEVQDKLNVMEKENTDIKKASYLTELQSINPNNKKLVELHKDSSVEALKVALSTAKAMKGDFQPHSDAEDEDKDKSSQGIGDYNPDTGEYE